MPILNSNKSQVSERNQLRYRTACNSLQPPHHRLEVKKQTPSPGIKGKHVPNPGGRASALPGPAEQRGFPLPRRGPQRGRPPATPRPLPRQSGRGRTAGRCAPAWNVSCSFPPQLGTPTRKHPRSLKNDTNSQFNSYRREGGETKGEKRAHQPAANANRWAERKAGSEGNFRICKLQVSYSQRCTNTRFRAPERRLKLPSNHADGRLCPVRKGEKIKSVSFPGRARGGGSAARPAGAAFLPPSLPSSQSAFPFIRPPPGSYIRKERPSGDSPSGVGGLKYE